MNQDDSTLSECGCCTGLEPITPRTVSNRPGQDSIAYRVGTHGAFKATMLNRLALNPRLRRLGTRQDDDPSVALLDAWAATLDVLTFYQERIATEGFLRTALERRSVLELARAVGYELRPGVAASTCLAFTVDDYPGGPTEAVIPAGTKTQSVPAQDEKPQLFETTRQINAKASWNAIPARRGVSVVPSTGCTHLHLKGVNLNLKPGDALLIIDRALDGPGWDAKSEGWDLRHIARVDEVADKLGVKTTTRVEWYPASYFTASAGANIYVFRQRASVFGYNAPDWRLLSATQQTPFVPTGEHAGSDWPHFTIYTPGTTDTIDLDVVYPKFMPGSWLVLSQPNYVELYRATKVSEASRASFGLTGKTTRVQLYGENLPIFSKHVRSVVVYTEPEPLTIALEPITAPVIGDSIWLDREVPVLPAGQLIAITGEDTTSGKVVSEIRSVKECSLQDGTTLIALSAPIDHTFKRESVIINGNVAPATHGETRTETLGSGDASLTFQRFSLSFKPLTHISASNAAGTVSTLEIRVNGAVWSEAASFHDLGPDDRCYIKRIADDGTVTISFGDGVTGARLPSGSQNVVATYRTGLGLAAMLKPGQLTLLLTRPLAVNGVINPTAPTGAGDPEVLDDARRNAPLTILTLGRIVSLQDYEDFARAFGGVGKAQAHLLWDGAQQLIHLTVAGADGRPFPEDSDPFRNLLAAIDQARHPAHRARVNSYTPATFSLSAGLLIDHAYRSADVLAAARAQLLFSYSSSARDLGQGVSASEIQALLQTVPGVLATNVTSLTIVGEAPPPFPILQALPAHWDGTNLIPAVLLAIDPGALTLSEMTL